MEKYHDIDEHFIFIRLITSTSKSYIWLASPRTHPTTFVAIKEIFISQIVNPQHVMNERAVLAMLRDLKFPKSPWLLGTSKNNESLFLIQTLVDGAPLHMHLPLRVDTAKRYFAETLSIVEFLHNHNVLYRDIKLSNLVLTKGRIHLVDFGLSKILATPNERRKSICGTPHAMAPEVARGSDYGFECDFFSLGILLYELLVGKPCTSQPVSLDHPYIVSAEAEDLLSQLLEPDPSKRLVSFEKIRGNIFFENCSADWWRAAHWDSNNRNPRSDPKISLAFIHGHDDVFKDF